MSATESSPPVPTAEEQLDFLRKLRRLLEEGLVTSTYKYALLHAIADLCVIKGEDTGAALRLSTDELARQFIRLYWRQVAPFPTGETDRPLKQNTGRQAAIVKTVREARDEYAPHLSGVDETAEWRRIVNRVERTVRVMPLWKLQTIGGERLEFLYKDREKEHPHEIVLRPGVAYCFRQFYSFIIDMVQSAWTRYVRRTNGRRLGPTSELRQFLFGTRRGDLSPYRQILEDVQGGSCFYCGRNLRRGTGAVDHFIPWRRYPFDLGHNFVLAHAGCNGEKGDRLAAVDHLHRWYDRNVNDLYDLPRRFEEAGLVHDWKASLQVTRWAYDQVSRAGGQVWVRGNDLVPLSDDWRAVLSV